MHGRGCVWVCVGVGVFADVWLCCVGVVCGRVGACVWVSGCGFFFKGFFPHFSFLGVWGVWAVLGSLIISFPKQRAEFLVFSLLLFTKHQKLKTKKLKN